MADDVDIRPYEPGDETSILEGWNAIFPTQDDLRRRDLAYWNWEFRRNTLARTEVVVAVADGRVVGQYASVPQRAVDEGTPITIGLIVDAFVLPEFRRAGGRPGLIIHLARALHDAYCGASATRLESGHSLLYGYPYPIWRIARRYLDSEIVRDMDVLFREVAAPGFHPTDPPAGVLVEQVTACHDVADALWKRVRDEVRFGVVRDGSYLTWRYLQHPEHSYRIFLARDEASGEARGIAVYRDGSYAGNSVGIVCDWLAPAGDDICETALLAALERQAVADGLPALIAVYPQNDPRFLRWQRKGFLVAPPSHFLVMNTFKHHVRHLRDRWFFTLGDSDLV